MRGLFWVGLVVLVLGLLSLFYAPPRRETHGAKAGDVSISVTTTHNEKLPAAVSAVLIAGGVGLLIAGGRSRQG